MLKGSSMSDELTCSTTTIAIDLLSIRSRRAQTLSIGEGLLRSGTVGIERGWGCDQRSPRLAAAFSTGITTRFIERLEDDGTYRAVDRSSFLPVYAAEIRRWVVEEDSHDQSAWARRLRAWVRAALAPRLAD